MEKRDITESNKRITYLVVSSIEKKTYSPESTIPSSKAARRISRIVVELAHITTTETEKVRHKCSHRMKKI
jgi:hypothetical protein